MNNDYNYNQYTPESPQREEPKRGDAIRTMVFGIVAAYCAWIPMFSPLGIIFGAIATKGGTNIMFAQPASRATFNFAKAGRITGKVTYSRNNYDSVVHIGLR